jgi:hypothetical protein
MTTKTGPWQAIPTVGNGLPHGIPVYHVEDDKNHVFVMPGDNGAAYLTAFLNKQQERIDALEACAEALRDAMPTLKTAARTFYGDSESERYDAAKEALARLDALRP